jgi:hypothetical protein
LRLALGTATPSAAGSTASLGRYPKAVAALGRRSRQNSVSSGSGGHGTLGDPCRAPGCTRLLRQSQMKTIFLGVWCTRKNKFCGQYTDKKENQIFLIYKKIQSGAVAKSYMRKGFLILYMRKCANISPYMRRSLVIYDLATAPF